VADTCDRGIVAGEVDALSGARDGLERGVGVLALEVGATLRQRLRVAGDGVELGACASRAWRIGVTISRTTAMS